MAGDPLSTMKIKVGISACLLGHKTRYDGRHTRDNYCSAPLGGLVEWVPVCPEVEYGLPVPREKMRLEDDPRAPRLVTIDTRLDHTPGMTAWTAEKLARLAELGLRGFIFKSGSPSCGLDGVKVYLPDGKPALNGTGIFARAFVEYFPLIPVESDERIHAPDVRENFIKALREWPQ